MTAADYLRLMRRLQGLPWFALITTGRTGSDFLQSLLDSHPQVLTFNGILQFHKSFWRVSPVTQVERRTPSDIVDAFIGLFIHKLKSRYDLIERKDQLGPGRDCSLDIDTAAFKAHAMGLLGREDVTARNTLAAVYGAYSLCLGQDLEAARIFFHHVHQLDELDLFLEDVPGAAVVVTTRDPRANFVSGIEHHRAASADRDNEYHLFTYIKRILRDSTPCEERGLHYIAVRLEDLPREDTMSALARWLGIEFAPSLLESSWGGLTWYGDRLSPRAIEPAAWREGRTDNKWRDRLGRTDQYVLNYLMHDRLRYYEYPREPTHWWDAVAVPFLALLPMKYERRYLSVGYLRAQIHAGRNTQMHVALNPFMYLRRVILFLQYYRRTLGRQPFQGQWLH